LTNIDLNTNELQNAVIQNLSSAPQSGNKEGRIYYDVTAKALYLYTNGEWKPLASGGAAASSLELTGDVIGSANVDPATGKITLDTTVVNNSVTLGDDTTGDYVAGINGTTNEIVVDNSGGEGSTPTISLPNTIYKPTTFSIGYQDGFDITFSDSTGDTYLNQTNGDGVIHALGVFSVDYATSANNPEYYAFRVDPAGSVTNVRNILSVQNDNQYDSIIFNGNESAIYLNNPNTDNRVLTINNSDDNAIITAQYSLNLNSGNGDISLNPDSNVVNIGSGYGELHLQKTEYSRDGQLQGIIAAQSDGSLRITGNNNGLQLETNNGGIFLNSQNGWTTFNSNIQISSEGEVYAQQGDLTLTGDSGNVVINNTAVVDNIRSKDGGSNDFVIYGGNSNIQLDGQSGNIELNPDSIVYVNGGATFANDVTIVGNLNVEGTLNAVNRTEINIEDNTIRLNTGFTGAPTADAGIIVERGTANDTAIIWNETNDQWTLSNDGNNYYAIARKYVEVIGDASNTSFDVVHNLGTRDITVMVRENNAEYNVVETDVLMKDGNTVTIGFTDAPALNAYKVIIVG
jgi:hypothetical protein